MFQKNYRTALLSLGAAFAYAVQHPFAKPFIDEIGGSASAYAKATIISEFFFFSTISILAFLFKGRVAIILKNFISSPVNIAITAILALINTISEILYFICLNNVDTVYLSLILNLFPIYMFFIITPLYKYFINFFYDAKVNIDHPHYLNLTRLSAFFIASFGIFLTYYLLYADNLPDRSLLLFFGQFCLISLIPILFGINALIFDSHFSTENTIVSILFINAIDSPIAIVFAYMFITFIGDPLPLPNAKSYSYILLYISIISSYIIGKSLLQKAMKKQSGLDSKWHPAFYFFMVPIFVALIGETLYKLFGIGNVRFHIEHLYGLVAIMIAFIIHFYNEKGNGS